MNRRCRLKNCVTNNHYCVFKRIETKGASFFARSFSLYTIHNTNKYTLETHHPFPFPHLSSSSPAPLQLPTLFMILLPTVLESYPIIPINPTQYQSISPHNKMLVGILSSVSKIEKIIGRLLARGRCHIQ